MIKASHKVIAADVVVDFDESMSYSTPYPDNEFDTVFSSLFFHHLGPVKKMQTFKEIYRVMKPGGEFHICDWGRPSNPISKIASLGVRLLDGF